MAPEVHQSHIYDISHADRFSLAVILFIMVYGSPPFANTNDSDQHYTLMQADDGVDREFMKSLKPNVS